MNLEQDRRMTLKIGINRFLFNRGGGEWVSQVRKNFVTVTDELFDSVVDEMVSAGELLKVVGKKGGVTLQQIFVKENNNGTRAD
jgi:hypothetical protein